MCEDAFSTHLYTQTQTSIGCGRWHNAQQRDWLVMNVFCERKHSESGCGLAASAVLRVSLFVYKASSRASPGPLSPAVSLLPLRCHHLASNQLCTVAPFLLFFKLSSIQETWLQPAYFMKDQPPTVYPSIHPSIQLVCQPSIHPSMIDSSVRLQGYNPLQPNSALFTTMSRHILVDNLLATSASIPPLFSHDDVCCIAPETSANVIAILANLSMKLSSFFKN